MGEEPTSRVTALDSFVGLVLKSMVIENIIKAITFITGTLSGAVLYLAMHG